ncbi:MULTISPECIES: gas vesicle protein GvpO, halophile-type [unclassified Haladaptatus]|uniref:gas vesicle protein GvpO, halophile-type n=1 Tax=unclassified Haladaptatus TaxID=2622732 RepID=UPI0023E871EF|nr:MULTISPECIES: gas vesicle protein GvpO [unclassified Haladaptatus]
MSDSEAAQCHALTEGGERCGRTAADGKFCYQHDESDPTVDDADESQDAANQQESTEDTQQAETGQADGGQQEDDSVSSILDVRSKVETTSADLIGHDLDGVTEVMQDGDEGWRAVVEVVERHSVPDTQDILGQYEVLIAGDGSIQGYSRLGRYRRADTGSRA